MVLDEHSFDDYLDKNKIVFAGNGNVKWQAICESPNALFSHSTYLLTDLAAIAAGKYDAADFTGLTYFEPAYLKSVYTGTR